MLGPAESCRLISPINSVCPEGMRLIRIQLSVDQRRGIIGQANLSRHPTLVRCLHHRQADTLGRLDDLPKFAGRL